MEDKDANNAATEIKIIDGFGVGTLIPTFAKNVFRDDLANKWQFRVSMEWNENRRKSIVLIGNIYT